MKPLVVARQGIVAPVMAFASHWSLADNYVRRALHTSPPRLAGGVAGKACRHRTRAELCGTLSGGNVYARRR